MPRPPRLDFPGALHHATNVGLSNRTVFERAQDVRYFLSRVARAVRRGEILVHAYALLTTHFHLLVGSPLGRLSIAMRRIQAEYSKYFNRTRGRSGPLYERRYFSKVVDSEVYLDNVVRYIDGNAVHAGLVAKPEWHPSASVFWYVREKRPLWLSQGLLVSRALRKSGAETFSADLYRRVFAPRFSEGMKEWMQARISRGESAPDPLSDLMDAAPTQLLAWMHKQARLADGTTAGAPLVPWDDVFAVVASATCDLEALGVGEEDGRACTLEQLLLAGLLRQIAGLSYARISRIVGCSSTAAHRRCLRHAQRMQEDHAYATVAGDLAYQAMGKIY